MKNDLDFIGGNFLYGDVPMEKEYLLHYFQGSVERSFLSYYFLFSHLYSKGQFLLFYNNFCDHTGFCCSTRWVRKLLIKLNKIENALQKADKDFDLNRVGEIKSGKASFI